MSGDVHVQFCERPGVRFPRATHRNLYVRSRRAGQRVMASVTDFLARRLKLTVNAAKSAVDRPSARAFLGFSFTAGPTPQRVVSPKALARFKVRVRELGSLLNSAATSHNQLLNICRQMWSSTFVDEFSYRKRHHYLTLVVDHDRQRVVWAGKGRSAQTLEAFFDRLGPAGCERLQLVTADLAASWQKALRARVPHARLVFDRFHVERLATEAVDEVRRAEQRGADAKTAKTLKGSRYCLLKHPKRLKPGEKRRLAAVRLANRALDRAYELKEYLATILEQATPDDARELLDQWLDWASRSRLAPFVKLARTIRKHAVGILAYLDTRMTNGPVEGINNKLRVIARRAYGFHSHGALISMLFLCCGGIELAPPLPTRV